MGKKIQLPKLPRAIKEQTGGKTLSYSSAYRAAVSCSIPAVQTDTGRWFVDSDDIPQIIKDFELYEVDDGEKSDEGNKGEGDQGKKKRGRPRKG